MVNLWLKRLANLTSFENFRLDLYHYIGPPEKPWNVILKITGHNLELISKLNMYVFIEKPMKGGIPYITHRYGQPNNVGINDYDEK